MENNQEIARLIDKYILGQMDQGEKEAFEQQMNQDEGLTQAVAFHRSLKLATQAYEQERMEKMIQEVTEVPLPIIKPFWQRTNFLLSLAAAVLVLLSAYYFWPQPSTGDELLATRNDTILPQNISGWVDSLAKEPCLVLLPTDVEEAWITAYKMSDWSKLKDISLPQSELGQFYAGLIQVHQLKAEKAIPLLEPFKAHPSFGIQAHWYLALAHLQQGNIDTASDYLLTIDLAWYEQHNEKRKVVLMLLGGLPPVN